MANQNLSTMKTYAITIIFAFCASLLAAQNSYSPKALAKNNRTERMSMHSDSLETALKLLDEAIAIDPSLVNAYGNKADILESLKCSEEALQTILDAEQYVDKRNPYYYLGKGNILLKNGRDDEASEAYAWSLQLFEGMLKSKPTPELFINYVTNKYFVDGIELSLAEIEKLMPATFSAMEKKQVTDFFEHMGTPARIKEALLAKGR